MSNPSLGQRASNLRVFSALFLSFLLIMMPFAQMAAASVQRSTVGGEKSDRKQKRTKPGTAQATAEDLFVDPPAMPVAGITATKQDAYPSNPSGKAAPGDTITYTVDVNNPTGNDATSVNFTDTIDPNTTRFGADFGLTVSPVAINDSYSTATSSTLSVPAAQGVLANDTGVPAPTVSAVNGSAANVGNPTPVGGGSLTLNADGSFSYTAPATQGPVNFTYTISNGNAPPVPGTDDTATVTINVDAAPTVSSTTPTNGATDLATSTAITVTFSESVSATNTAFKIECPTGTPVTFTQSASPATTFTLTPTSNLPAGVTCTVTVVKDQISDTDTFDPPDNMAADYVFSFSTDAPPSVLTTTPLNGASPVAANTNITINFSEPVTALGSAFTIECPVGTGKTFSLSGSGTSTLTLDPTADLPVGTTCTVTVIGSGIHDTDTNDPPDTMVGNYVFNFTIDSPPSVQSTTPTNGATNVGGNTTVTINFSESVSATNTAFKIECPTGSPVTFNQSASPASTFTLTPSSSLPGGTTCTVTVVANQITDTDTADPPDNMAANYVFSFSVDAAPSVSSTTPTNGANPVASNTNITINFSEPVNITDASAFTLECPVATPVAFSVTPAAPGASSSFVLDPTSDLPFGTVCTVRVVAAKVTDVDTNDPPDNMAADYVFSFTVDSPPSVTTTTPTNNSLSNLKSGNITINFSENVGVTAGGVTINCGAGNVSYTGLPQTNVNSIVLDPTSNLPPGSTCTVTVLAANVTDADTADPPDNMTGDYVFTFGVAPDAVNDAYNSTGNVGIVIAANGVLANDVGTGAVVDKVGTSTANTNPGTQVATSAGGLVTLNADGSFTYLPKPGQASGTDTFVYRISNSGGVSTDATVTITITGIVWFICDACASSNQGTLQNPYTSVGSFSTNNTGAAFKPSTGQRIYIESGTYDASNDNLTLLLNQIVSGQGQAATTFFTPVAPAPAAYAALTAGTRPIIAPTVGNAVTVNDGNNISFFNIGNSGSPTGSKLLTGPTTGNWSLTASNMSILGRGTAIDLSTDSGNAVTFNATFDAVGSSNSTGKGVSLTRVNGTLTINNVGSASAFTNVSGDDFFMDTGTATVSYSGTITNTAAHSINIANKTSGTVTFSGAISDTGTGILMSNNGGATFTFTGGLSLSTTTFDSFTATGGGTVNVTGTNTITNTTGKAVNIANTTIGGSGVTFQSINHNASNSGTNSAIILNTTGAGTFTVSGNGGTCTIATPTCTGGTIQNVQGADAISLNTVGGLVTLNKMAIQDISASGDAGAANDTRSGFDAIQAQTMSGGLTVNDSIIQRISDSGLNGSGGTTTPSATTFNNLTLLNCDIENVGRFNVAGHGDAQNEAAVYIWGIKGTVSVTNSTFKNDPTGMDFTTDTSGSLDMTITGNSFNTLYKEPGGTASVGNWGIRVLQVGSLNSIVRIGDKDDANAALGNTFTNGGRLAAIEVITQDTSSGTMKAEVNRNTSTVTDHSTPGVAAGSTLYNFPQGGTLLRARGSGNYEAIYGHNLCDQCMHSDQATIGQLSISVEKGVAEFIVQNNTFKLPWDAPVQIISNGVGGAPTANAQIKFTGNTYVSGTVGDGTTDLGGPSPYDPFYAQAENGGRLDLTIQTEGAFAPNDASSGFSHAFFARTTNSGDILNLFLQNTTSSTGYQFTSNPSTTFNLFKNGSASVTVQGVLNDNGNSGTATTSGTITLSNTAPVVPNITVAKAQPNQRQQQYVARAEEPAHQNRFVGLLALAAFDHADFADTFMRKSHKSVDANATTASVIAFAVVDQQQSPIESTSFVESMAHSVSRLVHSIDSIIEPTTYAAEKTAGPSQESGASSQKSEVKFNHARSSKLRTGNSKLGTSAVAPMPSGETVTFNNGGPGITLPAARFLKLKNAEGGRQTAVGRRQAADGRRRTAGSNARLETRNSKLSTALAPVSGETLNYSIGTLPAGKHVRITFKVTIDLSFTGNNVSNQGTVSGTLNGNPFNVSTDDPDTATPGDATLTPVLGPANAVDDNYTAFKNNTLNVPAPGVMANDTNVTSVTAVTGTGPCVVGSPCATTNGSVTLNSDGSFSYTPTAGYTGPDSFTYAATGNGADTATVNITVNDTSAIYINEVLFDPPSADAPNEYIELRGPASSTIPTGTYFVAIAGDAANNPGDVTTIIDLSGLTFGSNGYLVLLQMSNTYVTAAGATVVTSTTVGFGGLPGSRWKADAAATDLPNASTTFMLIQTGTAPTLTDDIDSANDGGFDGAVYAGWSVRDSISAMNGSANAQAYGAFSFRNTAGSGTGQGGEVIVPFIPSYVGRVCDSTGSTAADWVASGVLGGAAPNWTLGSSTETEPSSFAGNPLDHIGSTNFVNNAPVNTVPGAQNVNEDGTLTFNAGNANLISVADSDAGGNSVQVTLTATNGTMTLSGTAGLTFTPPGAGNDGTNDAQMIFTGTVTDINTALNGMTFTPTANYSGAASVQIATDDQGSTGGAACSTSLSDTDTVSITVTSVNDAPLLDNTGNMSLNSIPTNVPAASNPGTLVSDIIASAGGDRITDADAGAVEGIAVTAVDNTNGTWEFSTNNGGVWTAFGAPSNTTARLLASDANTRIRFQPGLNFTGTVDPGITFRAWDQTSGANGGTANTSTNGGATAFSTATETASILVASTVSVQDAKVAEPASGTASMLFTVTLNAPAPAGGASVQYATANGGATPATGGASCGTPGVDYVTVPLTTLNFAVGEQIKTVAVTICSDGTVEPDETLLLNLSNPTNATIANGQATGTITANTAGTFLISELRTSGPNGLGDDFVELYNNTNSPLTVAASDASAGYGVYKMGTDCNATPVLIGTIPNGTVIPARGHYLLVGSQYSLKDYGGTNAAAGNLTLTSDIETDRNVAVFSTANLANISSAKRLDAVGFGTNTGGGVCDLLREGTNLPAITGSTGEAKEYSFFRKECDFVNGVGCTTPGTPKDTNDNSVDFLLADTTGFDFDPGPGTQQHLGAPGPENLTSPINRDATMPVVLLDVPAGQANPPNRVRDVTSDVANASTFGTLAVRRRIVNNTGGNVTRLRFRIVEFTTLPAPNGSTADLRARTSSNVVVSGINDAATCFASTGSNTTPCMVTVKGTTLEQPPTQAPAVGGGLNATLAEGTITTGTPLAPGASTNVQFLLGIQTTGSFRFLIIVEALP